MEELIIFGLTAIPLFLGLLFSILSRVLYKSHLKKFATYTGETTGRLVRWCHHQSTLYAGDTGWFPLLSYDVGQQHYEKEEPIAYPKRGEADIDIVIHYKPDEPHKFYTNKDIYFRQVKVFKIAGYVALVCSLLFFYITMSLA